MLVDKDDLTACEQWRSCTWGELATLEYGKALRDYRSAEGQYPVFGTNGPIGWHTDMLDAGPGVIVGRKGAYRGIHYASGPFSVIDTAFYLKPKLPLNVRWAYYELLTHDINGLDSGSAIPSTSREEFYGLPVRVPPLPEQRAIAHILGTLDDKIELNRRMNEILESMARTLFKSWFVDFDPVHAKASLQHSAANHDWTVERARAYLDRMEPEIAALFPDSFVASKSERMVPEGWQETTLSTVALLNPEAWTARNAPETIVYVDLSNTKWGTIEKYETHEWQDAPSRAKRVLRTGDTILGTVRPGNGSYAFIGRDGLTGSTGFAVLRPVLPRDRALVWGYTTAPENIRRLAHVADGAAYPAVRPQVVSATEVTLPSGRIRDAFGRVCGPLLDRMEANQRESCALAALRETLLPELVFGRIRIPELERQGSSGRGAGRMSRG